MRQPSTSCTTPGIHCCASRERRSPNGRAQSPEPVDVPRRARPGTPSREGLLLCLCSCGSCRRVTKKRSHVAQFFFCLGSLASTTRARSATATGTTTDITISTNTECVSYLLICMKHNWFFRKSSNGRVKFFFIIFFIRIFSCFHELYRRNISLCSIYWSIYVSLSRSSLCRKKIILKSLKV